MGHESVETVDKVSGFIHRLRWIKFSKGTGEKQHIWGTSSDLKAYSGRKRA
jgi:hypothetical protein